MDYEKKEVMYKIQRVCKTEDRRVTPFKGQVFAELKKECLRSGRLFEDPVFPASDRSMFYTQSVPYGAVWKRPPDICAKPAFVIGTANQNDLDQGYLGDCWFIAACACIVQVPELFSNIVPGDQGFNSGQYAGIFHFSFWSYGEWVDVVVDDRLPVYGDDNKLIFCSNRQEPNEFWSALLEKAYAKLCLSYENLDGGNTSDALVDMTGGIQEDFEIKDMQTLAHKNDMWQILIKSRKHKSLIGSSIAPNPRIREAKLSNGLVMGHAYTITKIACLDAGTSEIKLIRLRNPWGNEIEWRGAWSDKSREWSTVSDEIKRSLGYMNMPEGEFWMSYDDFYRSFETMQFCELTPDAFSVELLRQRGADPNAISKLSWKMTAFHSEWVPGKTSGGSGKFNDAKFWTNPQFFVSVTDPDPDDNDDMATLIVALLQKYTRERRIESGGDPCEQFIQFRVYRVLNNRDAEMAKKTGSRLYASQLERISVSGPYTNQREITHRYRLKPGDYLIIPSCYEADVSGQFLLRLFTEKPMDNANTCVLHDHKTQLDERDKFFVQRPPNKWSELMSYSSFDRNNNHNNNTRSAYAINQNNNNLRMTMAKSVSFGMSDVMDNGAENASGPSEDFSELRIYDASITDDVCWRKVSANDSEFDTKVAF